MRTNIEHAQALREMISWYSTGSSPSSFGPEYMEALTAAIAALDPDNQPMPAVEPENDNEG